MIDLYTWTTPNGRKISIMLEELGVPYETHAIDIGKDDQFAPEFPEDIPNNKIPAIVDRDSGVALMELGAILIYLADKFGRFLPKDGEPRYRVLEWLMWQMGGAGPMLGQAHHFLQFNKGKAPYAEERYARKRSASTACSTSGLRDAASSPTNTPSPTWRPGPGSRAGNGRGSTSPTSRM